MAYYRLDILQAVLYQCHSNLHVHEGCKNEPDTNIYDIMFAYAYYQLMQDLQILTADSLSASCRILGGPLVLLCGMPVTVRQMCVLFGSESKCLSGFHYDILW